MDAKQVVSVVDQHKIKYFSALALLIQTLDKLPLFALGCLGKAVDVKPDTTLACADMYILSTEWNRVRKVNADWITNTCTIRTSKQAAKDNGACPCPDGYTGLNCDVDVKTLINRPVEFIKFFGEAPAARKGHVGQPHYGNIRFLISSDGGKTGDFPVYTCDQGWTGVTCDVATRLADALRCKPSGCSNRGKCSDQGVCICAEGYAGPACTYTIAPDTCKAPDGNTNCNGNGACTKEDGCVCNGSSRGTYCGKTDHL
jgi:hypothetical protein